MSGGDVWIFNVRRATASRFTFTEDNNWPTWTPDGTRVIFSSSREGAENLFSRYADGSGDARQLTTSERKHRPESVSPDGSALTYRETHPTDGWDVWKLRLDGDDAPVPFRATPFQEYGTVFSPDGRWIAYTSNESGQYEVYVVRFSGAGGKTIVSQGGGGGPIWARDGRELFYNTGKTMMVVPIAGEEVLTIGRPRVLFESEDLGDVVANYDVAPDGERFLVVRSTEAITELKVVLNWGQELKRLVPVE